MGHEIEAHKREWDTKKLQQLAVNAQNLEKSRQNIINLAAQNEISKKGTERQNAKILQ